jgi:DNA-binding SARP family transcriptional activator
MRFGLLGRLEVQAGGQRISVPRGKQRTIVAALLAAEGRVVAVPSLAWEVWGNQVPASAVPNLRTYVMRLRRRHQDLGERLTTSTSGYALHTEPHELDLSVFRDAAKQGHKALTEGDAAAAASAFDSALAQWRGRPLEDIPLGPTLNHLAQSLGEQYAQTVEDRAEAGLVLGDHRGVVDRLRPFVEENPLRERACGQLMLAHYRSGEIDAALRVFHQARDALRDELGIDPGRELSRLQQAMLARKPELETAAGHIRPDASGPPPGPGLRAPGAGRVPRQLPPAPAMFVGRTAELARTGSALRGNAGPVVIAIHGPGGVGKSALGLRAAHAVAGHYPDGQLYADLQGANHDSPALSPCEVLGRFLRALGVDRYDVPADEAEAAALFQSVLADRRVLLVLDNVAYSSQVRPLLPAGRGCGALITGRTVLSTLDAEQLALRELRHAESVAALTLQAGEARAAAEPGAMDAVARACGGHALALRIAGARLAARPDMPVSWLAERLARRRLAEWSEGDLDLRACFAAGYEALTDPVAARAFRLIGRARPGVVHARSVAALLGEDVTTAEAVLDVLVAARLLEPTAEGHFHMHRLLRLYAAELPEPGPCADRGRRARVTVC